MYDAHQNLLFHIQGRTHQASVGAATAGQIFSERLHAVEEKRSAWNFKRVVNRRGYLRVAAASHEFEGGVAVAADEAILAHVDQPMLWQCHRRSHWLHRDRIVSCLEQHQLRAFSCSPGGMDIGEGGPLSSSSSSSPASSPPATDNGVSALN